MESPRAWVAIRTLSSHPDRRGNRRLPPSCRVEIPGHSEFDDGETFSIQRPQAEHFMENGFCLARPETGILGRNLPFILCKYVRSEERRVGKEGRVGRMG